jgi:hypothetical protein
MKINDANQLKRIGRRRAIFPGIMFLWAAILSPTAVQADGGVVRTREVQGAWIITIFSPAEISRDRPTDVTVMVQRKETGEVLLDAAVDLSFTPPTGTVLSANDVLCGSARHLASTGLANLPGEPAVIRATRAQAANKLFYATSIVLRAVGEWQLRASIQRGGESVSITCVLPVGMSPRLAGLWPYLALPPFAILLFALNQRVRRRICLL